MAFTLFAPSPASGAGKRTTSTPFVLVDKNTNTGIYPAAKTCAYWLSGRVINPAIFLCGSDHQKRQSRIRRRGKVKRNIVEAVYDDEHLISYLLSGTRTNCQCPVGSFVFGSIKQNSTDALPTARNSVR